MVAILGQIFEAIEKDCLRKLEMGIFSDPACTTASLEESYVLRFAATSADDDDGDGDGGDIKGRRPGVNTGKDKNGKPKWVVDLGFFSAEDTQKQAMSLLRMLIISCQGLNTLDTTRPHVVSFKLFLNQAPDKFELSKFKDAATDTPMEWEDEPTKITIGGVVTEVRRPPGSLPHVYNMSSASDNRDITSTSQASTCTCVCWLRSQHATSWVGREFPCVRKSTAKVLSSSVCPPPVPAPNTYTCTPARALCAFGLRSTTR